MTKFEDALGALILAHEHEGTSVLIDAMDDYIQHLEEKEGGSKPPPNIFSQLAKEFRRPVSLPKSLADLQFPKESGTEGAEPCGS